MQFHFPQKDVINLNPLQTGATVPMASREKHVKIPSPAVYLAQMGVSVKKVSEATLVFAYRVILD